MQPDTRSSPLIWLPLKKNVSLLFLYSSITISNFILYILDLTRFSKGVSPLPRTRSKNRGKVVDVSYRLGTPMMPKPEWLVAIPKDQLPQPKRLAFPPTPVDGIINSLGFVVLIWSSFREK